jgi:hypothetical protein
LISNHPWACRSFPGIARKIWPYANQIVGEGPFVLAVHTPGRTVVMLWYWPDDLLDAYLELTGDGVCPNTLSMFDLQHLEQAGEAAARNLRQKFSEFEDTR